MKSIINHTFQIAPALLPWLIGLSFIAWAWLIWRCLRREPSRWLGFRLTFLSVAMISLLLAGLQPARLVESPPGMAILLTNAPSKSSLDSLQKEYPGIAIFQLGKEKNQGKTIPDLSFLHRHFPDIQKLFIIGNGLGTSDLQVLKNYQAHFVLNPVPEGIIELAYSEKVVEGKSFRLQGLFHHPENIPRQLVLESPAGNMDLLTLEQSGYYPFEYTFQTKETGRYLFRLRIEGKEKQILEEQLLPVEILASEKPKVLILNAAPSFETNYLKNWLADAGYGVAVRSAISRDKYRTEFHNQPNIALQPLTLNQLEQFDLLVLTTYTLEQLTSKERQLLKQATDAGLGLCLLAEPPFPPDQLSRADRQYFLDFPLQPGTKNWSVDNSMELAKAPLKIGKELGLSTLTTGNNQETISAYRLKENGRIALNLVANTYQFLLNGQNKGYQNFWTPIIEQAARQSLATINWRILERPILLPNEALTFELWPTPDNPIAQVISPDSIGSPLYFQQHPFNREQWEASFWPKQSGWHWVGIEESGVRSQGAGGKGEERGAGSLFTHHPYVHWFYVQPADSWQSLKIARQLKKNKEWILEHPFVEQEQVTTIKVHKPYPLWWFYIVFLFAAGLLWLEEKWH